MGMISQTPHLIITALLIVAHTAAPALVVVAAAALVLLQQQQQSCRGWRDFTGPYCCCSSEYRNVYTAYGKCCVCRSCYKNVMLVQWTASLQCQLQTFLQNRFLWGFPYTLFSSGLISSAHRLILCGVGEMWGL